MKNIQSVLKTASKAKRQNSKKPIKGKMPFGTKIKFGKNGSNYIRSK